MQKSPRRRWMLWVLGAVLLVVAAGGWIGFRAVVAVSALSDVRADVAAIPEALGGSRSDLRDIIDRMTERATVADRASHDPLISAASVLPIVGPTLHALQVYGTSAHELVVTAGPAVDDVVAVSSSSRPGRLADPALVERLAVDVRGISAPLARARRSLATIDTARVPAQVADVTRQLRSTVATGTDGLDRLGPLLQALPIVLANGTERNWLVVFQNLAEARGTGGLPSAWASLTADDGAVSLDAVGNNDEINNAGAVSSSAVPLAATQFWNEEVGNGDTARRVLWLQANNSGHYPYGARLLADGYTNLSGDSVDGVLTLGQGIVQYLVAATGPITVSGVTVTGDNASDFLGKAVYSDFPDVQTKDAVVSALIGKVFTKLGQGHIDLTAMMKSVFASDSNDRLLIWSSHPAEQRRIDRLGVGGSISTSAGSRVHVDLINNSGNKMDAYTKMRVDYSLGRCGVPALDGAAGRLGAVAVTLTNTAPASGLPTYVTASGGPPAGRNEDVVAVYLPVGAKWRDIQVDGEDAFALDSTERGRQVWAVPVDLKPGQSKTATLTWSEPMVEPASGDQQAGAPVLDVAPTFLAPTLTTSSTACG